MNNEAHARFWSFVGWLCMAAAIALTVFKPSIPAWLIRLPDMFVVPFADILNAVFNFSIETLHITVITRAFAGVVSALLDVTSNILTGSRGGFGLDALPWTVLAVTGFMIGYGLKGWRLGLLAGGCFAYFALFGQWKWAMETFAVIIVAAPLSVLMGFGLGVAAWRYKSFETLLNPVLNLAQSLPHFCYLIPVVVFFGVGDHAGAIATMIFATPPMIRMTILGLKKVPPEVVEAGHMSGATAYQLLRYVRTPTARADILVGVNQVIMQCFAMVVIASFIGAPGLGYKLLQLLQALKIGRSLEIGISIVLMAVALDRCSRAWAELQPTHYEAGTPFWEPYKLWIIWIVLVTVCFLLAPLHDWLDQVPRRQALSTAPFWDWGVDWIIWALDDVALAVRTFFSLQILKPIRDAFQFVPFAAVLLLVAGIGFQIGGWRSALLSFALIGFIALTGWWDRAMVTAYMVSYAVIVASLIGIPLGIWASFSEKRSDRILFMCDTLQTFPSFIYLIPVIMLFQVNDVSAIGAVLIYAIVPITRYTIVGLRSVPPALGEAVDMSGANTWQKMWNLSLPLALPHIMVGLNQTVMFSLFMVIIAAFIGTTDLGQEMMRALSSQDVGKGLVLGLCVAFMGIMVDHLATRWSNDRKKALGLE